MSSNIKTKYNKNETGMVNDSTDVERNNRCMFGKLP